MRPELFNRLGGKRAYRYAVRYSPGPNSDYSSMPSDSLSEPFWP